MSAYCLRQDRRSVPVVFVKDTRTALLEEACRKMDAATAPLTSAADVAPQLNARLRGLDSLKSRQLSESELRTIYCRWVFCNRQWQTLTTA